MFKKAMATLGRKPAQAKSSLSPPPATARPLVPPYKYKPLDRMVDSIRLLVLDPASHDPSSVTQPVTCRLIETKFADKSDYEALSYTWGPPNNLMTILVDGHEMMVGENLFWALEGLSLRGSRVLWVDAICINQDDLEERNQQVSLMAFIYSRARTVLVWLGNKRYREKWLADITNCDESYADQEAKERDALCKALCFHDYWSRVWIVQEIALAKNVICVYEDTADGVYKYEDWSIFMNSLKSWVGSKGALLFKLKEQRDGRHGDISRLEMLLANFWDAQCEEPRDKIYGFLGLAHDCQNDSLKIDYSKSLLDLYKDVVRFHQSAKPMTDPLPGNIDRAMRLVAFSQVVQRLFEGRIEAEFKNPEVECDASMGDTPPLIARGLIECAIVHLGPSYNNVVSSLQETKRWKSSFDQWYHTSKDLSYLRWLDEFYTSALLEMDEKDLAKICQTNNFRTGLGSDNATVSFEIWDGSKLELGVLFDEYGQWPKKFETWEAERLEAETSPSYPSYPIASDPPRKSFGSAPRRFLGSNRTMGLVPPQAEEGDIICRFWGCNVAAVLRWCQNERLFHIIGRAYVATEWQETESQPFVVKVFSNGHFERGGVIDVSIDIKTLQELTA